MGLDRATQASAQAFSGIVRGDPVATELSWVTVLNTGKELSAEPQKSSKLQLTIDHRLCWVLTYDDAQVPLIGTYNPTGGPNPAGAVTTDKSTLAVLVDAHTGDYIYATTY